MSECRVVDLKELGISKELFDCIYSMGEQDGRADAIDDVERELLKNGFIATHHALEVWHEISEQLKEDK